MAHIIDLHSRRRLLSRASFESLIAGEWKRRRDGTRTNGPFTTSLRRTVGGRTYKQLTVGSGAMARPVWARTWGELAAQLSLGSGMGFDSEALIKNVVAKNTSAKGENDGAL